MSSATAVRLDIVRPVLPVLEPAAKVRPVAGVWQAKLFGRPLTSVAREGIAAFRVVEQSRNIRLAEPHAAAAAVPPVTN